MPDWNPYPNKSVKFRYKGKNFRGSCPICGGEGFAEGMVEEERYDHNMGGEYDEGRSAVVCKHCHKERKTGIQGEVVHMDAYVIEDGKEKRV